MSSRTNGWARNCRPNPGSYAQVVGFSSGNYFFAGSATFLPLTLR
jgi:hypothetical protein